MSELLTDISAIAPYFTIAATTFGTQLAQEATQRVAEGTVDAGQGFFRRLFGRRSDEVAEALDSHQLDEGQVDALLTGLNETDRRRLAQALSSWLGGATTSGLAAERLVELVQAAAPAGSTAPGPVTSYGDRTINGGTFGDKNTFNFGDRITADPADPADPDGDR
ncbi:hypothetical protein [Kitasatospora sp. NBC_00458]|uniref:hypothetical protein n=1 Tax=Kitasatospora sp. NBC_00458 TaxID=2903568 RepID=UPI002E181DE3